MLPRARPGSTLQGVITLLLMTLNVFVWVAVLMLVAFAKFIVPLPGWRTLTSRWMTALAEAWISCNGAIFRLTGALRIVTTGATDLDRAQWYLVISNHRSWVDILVLQAVFNRRIPFLKFFLKQELIWVPLLGFAWWALDFPFMRRHSGAYLKQHPEARGADLEATGRACEQFVRMPTSIMNFVEGTRFTVAKRDASGSPYRHLLPPRAGGVAYVLAAMGRMLDALLDVTIAYREPRPAFWDLCCGRLDTVTVVMVPRPIEGWTVTGDYAEDPAFRRRCQQWLGDLWAAKDLQLDTLLPAGIDSANQPHEP